MMNEVSVFITRKAVNKPDESRSVVCADEDGADFSAGDQHCQRNNVKVVDAPHIFLQCFYLSYLGQKFQVADGNCRCFDCGQDNAQGKSPLNPFGSRYQRWPEAYSRLVGLSRLSERFGSI